jgi:hypothetical protein
MCKPCLRAGWGTLCSLVAIASLPRHGRNTEHGPFPRFWLTPSNYDGKLLSWSLGCGHLGLDVDTDAVLTRMFRALCGPLYWDRELGDNPYISTDAKLVWVKLMAASRLAMTIGLLPPLFACFIQTISYVCATSIRAFLWI